MANLKEVRDRIGSVNSTKQITSAMKMVSAAKLKKAQDAIIQMRPYAKKMQEMLVNVSAGLDVSENAYAQKRPANKVLYVVVTSNKGLCGAFNSNLNKLVRNSLSERADVEAHVFSIGKKGFEFFGKMEKLSSSDRLPVNANELIDRPIYENIAETAELLMSLFIDGEYDEVYLAYNAFLNAATQRPEIESFLPIESPADESSEASEYLFEPDKDSILKELIPKSLKTQLYKAILDSNAAEHGARMTAMHQATENAGELLKELKLSYNKARQAAITTEILEITSGAEALAAG